MLWTVPAVFFLTVGAVNTPYFVEQDRLYQEQKEPVIEVLDIQASRVEINATTDLTEIGW